VKGELMAPFVNAAKHLKPKQRDAVLTRERKA
jgi:hypothetical protein